MQHQENNILLIIILVLTLLIKMNTTFPFLVIRFSFIFFFFIFFLSLSLSLSFFFFFFLILALLCFVYLLVFQLIAMDRPVSTLLEGRRASIEHRTSPASWVAGKKEKDTIPVQFQKNFFKKKNKTNLNQ